MKNTLKRDDVVLVYDDPLTEERIGFVARLIGCKQRDLGTHDGRELQRWVVLPFGEGTEPSEVNLLAPDRSLRAPMTFDALKAIADEDDVDAGDLNREILRSKAVGLVTARQQQLLWRLSGQ